jgi:hypothetical protein
MKPLHPYSRTPCSYYICCLQKKGKEKKLKDTKKYFHTDLSLKKSLEPEGDRKRRYRSWGC